MASMHIFFISELTKEYFTRQIFKTVFWVGEVLHGSLVQLLLEHCDFLHIDISQGSVATRLRCGGIFKYELVANLPLSLLVKDFWKLVNICGSYGQEFGVLFFWDTVYCGAVAGVRVDGCVVGDPVEHTLTNFLLALKMASQTLSQKFVPRCSFLPFLWFCLSVFCLFVILVNITCICTGDQLWWSIPSGSFPL